MAHDKDLRRSHLFLYHFRRLNCLIVAHVAEALSSVLALSSFSHSITGKYVCLAVGRCLLICIIVMSFEKNHVIQLHAVLSLVGDLA